MEHGVGVADPWRKRFVRHGLPVNLLRRYLETSASFLDGAIVVHYRVVDVLHLKLLFIACQHSRLEDDCHRFAVNQAVLIIQVIGYAFVHDVVKAFFLIDNHGTNRTYALRVYVGTVQAILCKARQLLIRAPYRVAQIVRSVPTCIFLVEALLIRKLHAVVAYRL